MKKIIVVVLILMVATPVLAELQPKDLLNTFRWTHFVGVYADWGVTQYGLRTGRVSEGNPIARLYMDYPVASFAITTVANLAIHEITGKLCKDNKTLGWVVIVGLNLVRGYVIYHNMRAMR